MSLKFIRLSEVQRRTGYSKAWLYRLMSQKKVSILRENRLPLYRIH